MIIDAKGQTLGRMLAYAAKNALKGEDIIIVNAEKAVVSGKKEDIFRRNLAKLDIKNKGNYRKGPYHPKRPDLYVKKSLRGMLPYSKARGEEAFKRVKVYMGVPEIELKRRHNLDISKEKLISPVKIKTHGNSVTVGEICSFIGGST